MEKLRADLHIHTYYSDGLLSPAEVVAEAVKNGVGLIAVTDHDCMLANAEIAALCAKAGIKSVNGIEVSAYEGDVKIHTLGYNIDGNSAVFKEFSKILYEGSLKRAEDIIYKLNKNGVKVSLDEVLSFRKYESSPLHAMHISRTCAQKGYCNGNAFNFYSNYLASGKCAFSRLFRPTPEQAVEAINASGGFASLAHPGRIDMSADELLQLLTKLVSCGLCGIEGVYSTHTVTETAYYKETAKAFSLVVTGGSDTHFFGGKKIIGTPVFYADEALADKLKI